MNIPEMMEKYPKLTNLVWGILLALVAWLVRIDIRIGTTDNKFMTYDELYKLQARIDSQQDDNLKNEVEYLKKLIETK